MKKQIITTGAPVAVGPYSQGIVSDGFIYVSGQLPVDMGTNKLITDDIKKAVTASLSNVAAIIRAGGSDVDGIVKITMFLSDIGNYTEANEAYAEFFKDVVPPARSCFQVGCLPKNAIVEVEAVAVINR